MSLTAQAWGHDGKTYTGRDMRENTGLHAGNGITDYGGFTRGFKATAQGSPGPTLSVALGRAIVLGSGAGIGGAYGVYNDAAMNSGSFTATAGNPRIDRLILRVTSGVPALEIVQGTAAGSPVAPTIPGDNYLPITRALIPAGTSNLTNAMLTDERVFIGRWAEVWGEVAYTSWNSDAPNGNGGAVNAADVGSGTVSWTAVANRKYKITIDGHVYTSVADTLVHVLLTDGSNNIKRRWDTPGVVANFAGAFHGEHREIGIAAGVATRKLRMYPQSGGGIGHFFADTDRIASLLVEDIGPAANPD